MLVWFILLGAMALAYGRASNNKFVALAVVVCLLFEVVADNFRLVIRALLGLWLAAVHVALYPNGLVNSYARHYGVDPSQFPGVKRAASLFSKVMESGLPDPSSLFGLGESEAGSRQGGDAVPSHHDAFAIRGGKQE